MKNEFSLLSRTFRAVIAIVAVAINYSIFSLLNDIAGSYPSVKSTMPTASSHFVSN